MASSFTVRWQEHSGLKSSVKTKHVDADSHSEQDGKTIFTKNGQEAFSVGSDDRVIGVGFALRLSTNVAPGQESPRVKALASLSRIMSFDDWVRLRRPAEWVKPYYVLVVEGFRRLAYGYSN